MRYFLLLALPLVFLTTACDDESFSQTVDIPFPEHEPLPAMSMDMRSGDSSLFFRLALSRGILDERMETSRAASITLLKDEQPFFSSDVQMDNSDGSNAQVRLDEPISDEPASYRLIGKVEGFPDVEATQTMPAKPDFTLVSYEPDGAINVEGLRVDKIELDLRDDAAIENYYGFRVMSEGSVCSFNENTGSFNCRRESGFARELFVDSPDPLFKESVGYGLVVTDQSFNGGTLRVRLQADNYSDAIIALEVYNLTEDAYRYAVSKLAYDDAGDNPFAEPVNVHNNVAEGYGIFIVGNRVLEVLEE